MVDVFLDLWGVLTDSRKMTAAYRSHVAELLKARHGGSVAAWRGAHDAANAWYSAHMDRSATWKRGSWREVVDHADAENVLRMFREVGIEPPRDPLAVSRGLDVEVMSGIDAAFPDARPAVARLKQEGHGVYVSTNATEANARGALTGARLVTEFHAIFTGELMNAGKKDPAYWQGIVSRLGVDPAMCLVVDDRHEYLRAASRTGFRCLLMDREGAHPPKGMPSFVEATLRNLAGLPAYVANAGVKGARARA